MISWFGGPQGETQNRFVANAEWLCTTLLYTNCVHTPSEGKLTVAGGTPALLFEGKPEFFDDRVGEHFASDALYLRLCVGSG